MMRSCEVEQEEVGRASAGFDIQVRALQIESLQLGCLWFEVSVDRSHGRGIALTRLQHMAVDKSRVIRISQNFFHHSLERVWLSRLWEFLFFQWHMNNLQLLIKLLPRPKTQAFLMTCFSVLRLHVPQAFENGVRP